MQRRTSSRAEFFQPFDGQVTGVGNVRWFSANLGVGGVFLRTNHPLPPGAAVTLRLPGAGAPLEVEGVVAWRREFEPISISDGLPGMGIRFRRADFEAELRIRQLLDAAELERTVRRRLPPPPPPEALAAPPAVAPVEPPAAGPGAEAELTGPRVEPEGAGRLLLEEPLAPDAFDLALAESYSLPSPPPRLAAVIPVAESSPGPVPAARQPPARRGTARLLATVGAAAALLALGVGAATTYTGAASLEEPPGLVAPRAAVPASTEPGRAPEPAVGLPEAAATAVAAAPSVPSPSAPARAVLAAPSIPSPSAPASAAAATAAPLAVAPHLLRPELTRTGSGFELSIRATEPVAVRHFPLRQPSRLVFDVPASAAATLPAKLKLPAGSGATVRIGRHGATSRVVVEFPGPLPRHEVRALPDGVVLSISR